MNRHLLRIFFIEHTQNVIEKRRTKKYQQTDNLKTGKLQNDDEITKKMLRRFYFHFYESFTRK